MDYQRFVRIVIRDFSAFGGQPILYILALFMLIFQEYALFWKYSIGILSVDVISLMIRTFRYRDRPLKVIHNNFFEKLDASSFPSIHAGRAIVMFSILSSFFANIYATVLFGVIATGICYSRIYLKKHYVSDVIGGIVLGAIISFIVLTVPLTIFPV